MFPPSETYILSIAIFIFNRQTVFLFRIDLQCGLCFSSAIFEYERNRRWTSRTIYTSKNIFYDCNSKINFAVHINQMPLMCADWTTIGGKNRKFSLGL